MVLRGQPAPLSPPPLHLTFYETTFYQLNVSFILYHKQESKMLQNLFQYTNLFKKHAFINSLSSMYLYIVLSNKHFQTVTDQLKNKQILYILFHSVKVKN